MAYYFQIKSQASLFTVVAVDKATNKPVCKWQDKWGSPKTAKVIAERIVSSSKFSYSFDSADEGVRRLLVKKTLITFEQ